MKETILIRIGRITIAFALASTVCIVAIGPTLAGDHQGEDHGRAAEHHHDRRSRDRRHYEPAQPNYYYAPPPNYYSVPEPEYPPSQGINLFFGL